MVDLVDPHFASTHVEIVVHVGQRFSHGANQVVVHIHRHIIGEQCRLKAAFVILSASVIDVSLNTATERCGQRVFVVRELFVVLMKCFATNFAIGADQHLPKRRMRKLDFTSFVVFDFTKTQIRII